MINTEDLTLKQVRELQSILGSNTQNEAHPWEIGAHYVIRTVTMIQTGTLKAVYKNELLLSEAVWVADTGRFHDFLKDPSKLNESEPFTDDVIVGRGSIVDAQKIPKYKASQK